MRDDSGVRFPTRRQEVSGVAVDDLARQFGTPVFVYDAATIRARIAELAAFDVIRYAQKANANLAILQLCREAGVVVDAVSAGECLRALAAGYESGGEPPGIVYTADVFDRASLDVVAEHGIHVNCGSPDMIEQYAERLGDAAGGITLRINPGFGHGHHQKVNTGGETSKHGIWHEDLEQCVEIARRVGVPITGMHTHIGSGADLEHLARVAASVCGFARRVGPSITTVSAGGGLSVPYRDGEARIDAAAYFEVWNRERESLQAEFGHRVSLEIEPGRFLMADAGYLITEIRAIKRMGSLTYYLVDAGFNDLVRPAMYGARHPISLAVPGDRPDRDVVVAGPLCESGDVFTQGAGGVVETRRLPEAHVGEQMIIECAGAYAASMASNYNSKPLAAEVLVEGGVPRIVRERQPLTELFGHDLLN